MKKIVVLLIAVVLSSLSIAAPAPYATMPGLPQTLTLDEYVNQVFGPEPLKAIASAKKGDRLWFVVQSKRTSTSEMESGWVRTLRFKLEKECWQAKLDCQFHTLPHFGFPVQEKGVINLLDPSEYNNK